MIRPMKNASFPFSAVAFAVMLLPLANLPAEAWTPPAVGKACAGARGNGPQYQAIAGNFLGGRLIRDGIVDRKSFQSCFRTARLCENWLVEKARYYPLAPGLAQCTPVVLR
jgi:hypothetical protein